MYNIENKTLKTKLSEYSSHHHIKDIDTISKNLRTGFAEEASFWGSPEYMIAESVMNSTEVRVLYLNDELYAVFGIIESKTPDEAYPWMMVSNVKANAQQIKFILSEASMYLTLWSKRFGSLIVYPWEKNEAGIKFCNAVGFEESRVLKTIEGYNAMYDINMKLTPMIYHLHL